jgi:peptidoglycan/LPS O-acetylase OafA/YrhL
MTRRLAPLGGLAILAVIINHAAGWGLIAMYWWTNQYRTVSVPNYEQFGSPTYYILLSMKQLPIFAVPAFLVISGFFIAFSARGEHSALSWKMIRTRLADILIPFAIWSIIFLMVLTPANILSPSDYIHQLLYGTGAYFYIPLICQCYLIAPFLIDAVKNRPAWVLGIAGAIQLVFIICREASIYGMRNNILDLLCFLPEILFLKWIFFFVLGMALGLHNYRFQQWFARTRWGWLAALIVLAVLNILEPDILFHQTGIDLSGGIATLIETLYAVAFLICFLAFDNIQIPFANSLARLGGKIYGIYLLHPQVLLVFAKLVYHIAPALLEMQVLFLFLLVVVGLGCPLLLMFLVTHSPARRAYRYLFG